MAIPDKAKHSPLAKLACRSRPGNRLRTKIISVSYAQNMALLNDVKYLSLAFFPTKVVFSSHWF